MEIAEPALYPRRTFASPVVTASPARLPIAIFFVPLVNTPKASFPIPTLSVAELNVPCGGAAPSGDMRMLSVKLVMLLITSVSPLRSEAPPPPAASHATALPVEVRT